MLCKARRECFENVGVLNVTPHNGISVCLNVCLVFSLKCCYLILRRVMVSVPQVMGNKILENWCFHIAKNAWRQMNSGITFIS